MTRCFTRLFAARTPTAARPKLTASLHLESLEVRLAPSAISSALKQISSAVKAKGISQIPSTTTLAGALTLRGPMVTVHR